MCSALYATSARVSIISTSFFSQSLCNSSAVIRRALSAGGLAGGGAGWLTGFCESSVSFELQPRSPTVSTQINSNKMKQRIGLLHPVGGNLEYRFVSQIESNHSPARLQPADRSESGG